MLNVARDVTQAVTGKLRENWELVEFLEDRTNGLGVPLEWSERLVERHANAEVIEKTQQLRYPHYAVFCERLVNKQWEKFRQFSGRAEMVVEARVSVERLELMYDELQAALTGIFTMLGENRGDWGTGLFYGGGYEITFEPVKQGGKNFVQRARVNFPVEVSRG